MSHSRSAVAITILLLLILCCRTGSLLVISPTELVRFAHNSAKFECHFDSCAGLLWNGPGIGVPQHYMITTGEHSTSLTINNLTESDEGPYFCTCNGRNSTQADLTVNHYPNVDDVMLHQTFQRGDAAAIECDAYLGDPVYPLVWVRNGTAISPDSDNQKTLTIVNIDNKHAGTYECRFNAFGESIIASIIVNVQERSEPMYICRQPPQTIHFSYASQQPLNLTCDCRTDKSDSSLVFQWNIPNLPIVQSSSLVVPYDQVSNGRYTCQAFRDGVLVEQHVREVTVIDIPPLPASTYTDVRRREGETAHLRYELLLQPSPKLNFQWKKVYTGSNTDVDFGSRFSYTVNDKTLRFNITNLVAADTGMYMVNVSNQYGHSELHTNIDVEELDRSIVILEFKAISCDSIEMHEEDIVAQVVEKVKACPFCEVELDPEIDTSCTPSDDGTVTFQFTLVSTVPLDLQSSNAISLMIDGNVTALICPNACLPVSTSPPPPPSGDTSVIVAVVVSVLITVLVVLLVLISTFTLKKFSRGICDKHQVGHIHEEDDQPEVVIQAPAAECTGYIRVNRTDPSHTDADPADPTATPVSVPFPPHIAPAPSATAKAKRPDRLYIRSHSYHGSTRTPQA